MADKRRSTQDTAEFIKKTRDYIQQRRRSSGRPPADFGSPDAIPPQGPPLQTLQPAGAFIAPPGRIAKKQPRGGLFDLPPTGGNYKLGAGFGGIPGTPYQGPSLQTSQPTQPAGAGIPELTLAGGDVPVPQGLPLPEAPEKVGKGKKVLRGLRDIIPIIAITSLLRSPPTLDAGYPGQYGQQIFHFGFPHACLRRFQKNHAFWQRLVLHRSSPVSNWRSYEQGY